MADDIHFEDNSDRVMRDMDRVAAAAVTKVMLMITGQVKPLTRVDSGALRDSWDHDVEVSEREVTGKIGSPLDYAIYEEFGTGEFAENGAGRKGGWVYETPDGEKHFTMGNKPQKMLRTAMTKNKGRAEEILGKDLGSNFRG